MKKLGLFILLIAMSVIAYAAVIYEYTAKDGKVYYTGGYPTGLSTAEKAQYKTTTQANIDKGIVIPPNARELTKAQQRKDNAPVVVPPVVVPPVVTPPVVTPPVTDAKVYLPKSATNCYWEGGTCAIPAGVTARVYIGAGGLYAYKDNVSAPIACTKSAIGDPKNGYNNNTCYWVAMADLQPVLDPKGANLMPYVNTALTPKGDAGFSVPMIKAAPIPPADKAGAFRISCKYSHGNNDDPIVYPGVPNASHHHTFFGNTSINAYSTSEGITKTGNSTCAGGILNRSGYWMPSLINTATGAPVKPDVVVVYYKSIDEYTNQYVTPPPKGLRMIAGNAKPLAVADAHGGMYCQDLTKVNDAPKYGILWSGNNIKGSCGGSSQLFRMDISFPQCWNGKDLDSPDHKSHMAYACGNECLKADGTVGKIANGCPASHPVPIPNITINADWTNLDPNAKYRLASDNYSTSYNGGYSLHADWMNGWDETIISRVVKNCLNNPKNCGGPNLGDGETLYGVNQD